MIKAEIPTTKDVEKRTANPKVSRSRPPMKGPANMPKAHEKEYLPIAFILSEDEVMSTTRASAIGHMKEYAIPLKALIMVTCQTSWAKRKRPDTCAQPAIPTRKKGLLPTLSASAPMIAGIIM